jgi:hypothetical protein
MSRLPFGWQKYACQGRCSQGICSTRLWHFFWHSCISSTIRFVLNCFLISVLTIVSLSEIPNSGRRNVISDDSILLLSSSLGIHITYHGPENITFWNTNIFCEHTVDFEVLTAMTMKNDRFWDVTPCNLVDVDVLEERTASTLRADE